MILVSFNKKTNKITMASFLRDNYVQLPDDYLPNRLNAAYAIGGMEMLVWQAAAAQEIWFGRSFSDRQVAQVAAKM